MIKKYELKRRTYYFGTCRNTNFGMWDGEKFIFINFFFETPHIDSILHFEDVKFESYDGFIPIREVPFEYNEIIDVRLSQDYKNSARKIYKNVNNKDLSNEIWKPIPEYEGLYYVSNLGRVKKHDGNKIMKQNFSRDYLIIGLTGYDRKRKTLRVHRLVAMTFQPNDEHNILEVNHDNGIKSDNRNSNLEWTTHKSNSEKIYTSGNYHKKLKPEMVVEIKNLLNSAEITQIKIAKKFNVSRSTISEINTGKKWVTI